jgi:hypothetical protein
MASVAVILAGGFTVGPVWRPYRKGGRQVIRKALLFMIPLAAAWLIASQRQDIVRYLKIRQMSLGGGHPENVPPGGSQRYPKP